MASKLLKSFNNLFFQTAPKHSLSDPQDPTAAKSSWSCFPKKVGNLTFLICNENYASHLTMTAFLLCMQFLETVLQSLGVMQRSVFNFISGIMLFYNKNNLINCLSSYVLNKIYIETEQNEQWNYTNNMKERNESLQFRKIVFTRFLFPLVSWDPPSPSGWSWRLVQPCWPSSPPRAGPWWPCFRCWGSPCTGATWTWISAPASHTRSRLDQGHGPSVRICRFGGSSWNIFPGRSARLLVKFRRGKLHVILRGTDVGKSWSSPFPFDTLKVILTLGWFGSWKQIGLAVAHGGHYEAWNVQLWSTLF